MRLPRSRLIQTLALTLAVVIAEPLQAQPVERLPVEGQPLGANVQRIVQTLDYLGAPLAPELTQDLADAIGQRDASAIQSALDPHVLLVVSINPELRVKVRRGPVEGRLQQGGYTPVLVKVLNEATVTNRLRIVSPQSGPVYAGPALGILERQAQTELKDNENTLRATDRFLELEMYQQPPLTRNLSGLSVEYAIGLIYASESGLREATIGFDIGAGNQDLGFRGEVPILFKIRPAITVPLQIRDVDGSPTAARLTIRDAQGHVYPPQAKRLAPDFFFQPQIYRHDQDSVRLPPGTFEVTYSRGPEYRDRVVTLEVPASNPAPWRLQLERWINPREFGFYCGDHHIHAAGCSHYDSPTQGVTPADIFAQIKGEGLNVGCVLTWGPCFDYQRQFFSPTADALSEAMTVMKYDLEISGFGSHAMGHVCLLNLRDQTYPGSQESKDRGWPTWTVPVLRWAKEQGGFTGFPHSAFDYDLASAARHLLERFDDDQDGQLNQDEAPPELLPASFEQLDGDGNQRLDERELAAGSDQAIDELPNVALPNMNGGGALEICVSTAAGVCDFISAMDTERISEWNIWYHLLNCGFPLKVSGETDFPCMSGRRIGQGRVYVDLGEIERVDFGEWCAGLAQGRSYVSDGYAHALEFAVEGNRPGRDDVRLDGPSTVMVEAKVAFAREVPEGVAYGNQTPPAGRRVIGDTVNLHAPRSEKTLVGGERAVELVVNGEVVKRWSVEADGHGHTLTFELPIQRSCWVALRHFPQLHTNPVNVIVSGHPIRASRASALWCAETIRLLWKNRRHLIAESERRDAQMAYDSAIRLFEQRAAEAPH